MQKAIDDDDYDEQQSIGDGNYLPSYGSSACLLLISLKKLKLSKDIFNNVYKPHSCLYNLGSIF